MSAKSIGKTTFSGGLHGRETLNRPVPAGLAAPWTKNGSKTLPRETVLVYRS